MEDPNSPEYLWNNKPASEETGHMLNCHSPILSDELRCWCSWLLTTILFMSLAYVALAVITVFCKLSSMLDLWTNYRPAKSTIFLTDFHGTGRNTTEHWKDTKGNCCTLAIYMMEGMRKIKTARQESNNRYFLLAVQSVQFSVICVWCCNAYGTVRRMHRERRNIYPQHLRNKEHEFS